MKNDKPETQLKKLNISNNLENKEISRNDKAQKKHKKKNTRKTENLLYAIRLPIVGNQASYCI